MLNLKKGDKIVCNTSLRIDEKSDEPGEYLKNEIYTFQNYLEYSTNFDAMDNEGKTIQCIPEHFSKYRETIKLTPEQLCDVVYDDSMEFELIFHEITGTSRHGNYNESIIKRIFDNKYFKVKYEDSIKDNCSFLDMNRDTKTYTEVFPKEKTIIIYE